MKPTIKQIQEKMKLEYSFQVTHKQASNFIKFIQRNPISDTRNYYTYAVIYFSIITNNKAPLKILFSSGFHFAQLSSGSTLYNMIPSHPAGMSLFISENGLCSKLNDQDKLLLGKIQAFANNNPSHFKAWGTLQGLTIVLIMLSYLVSQYIGIIFGIFVLSAVAFHSYSFILSLLVSTAPPAIPRQESMPEICHKLCENYGLILDENYLYKMLKENEKYFCDVLEQPEKFYPRLACLLSIKLNNELAFSKLINEGLVLKDVPFQMINSQQFHDLFANCKQKNLFSITLSQVVLKSVERIGVYQVNQQLRKSLMYNALLTLPVNTYTAAMAFYCFNLVVTPVSVICAVSIIVGLALTVVSCALIIPYQRVRGYDLKNNFEDVIQNVTPMPGQEARVQVVPGNRMVANTSSSSGSLRQRHPLSDSKTNSMNQQEESLDLNIPSP